MHFPTHLFDVERIFYIEWKIVHSFEKTFYLIFCLSPSLFGMDVCTLYSNAMSGNFSKLIQVKFGNQNDSIQFTIIWKMYKTKQNPRFLRENHRNFFKVNSIPFQQSLDEKSWSRELIVNNFFKTLWIKLNKNPWIIIFMYLHWFEFKKKRRRRREFILNHTEWICCRTYTHEDESHY